MSKSKSTRNTGKPWTAADITKLWQLAKRNTPARTIGLELGRTEKAIHTKALARNIELKPAGTK
jgi:hypothetical protein